MDLWMDQLNEFQLAQKKLASQTSHGIIVHFTPTRFPFSIRWVIARSFEKKIMISMLNNAVNGGFVRLLVI